jgi:hypothetical protein
MKRLVEPEILDGLSADDPAAVASRRDLRLINRIMGNTRWLRRALMLKVRPQDLVVELGAGDGSLGYSLAWDGEYTGLDLAPMPPSWPENFDWVQGDFFQANSDAAARLQGASVVIGGLILHHFSEDQLRSLGRSMRGARLLIFCEPARRQWHIWQAKALRLLGINHVTQHDLPVSVRAGFLGRELAASLGLDESDWSVRVQTTFFGAYRFVAERRSSAHE